MNQKTTNTLQSLDAKPTIKQTIVPSILHAVNCAVSTIMPVIILLNSIGMEEALKQDLIQNVFFVSAIGIFLQTLAFKKLGARLPLVMGCNFAFLVTLTSIATAKSYEVMLGSILIGGVVSTFFGFFAKYLNRLISPLTKGLIVFAVGASILTSATANFAGGLANLTFGEAPHFIVAIITVISIILFEIAFKGNIRNLSILFGMIVGFIAAICIGIVDFNSFITPNIISLPKPYIHFKFNLESIITVTLVYLIATTEVIGNTNALTNDVLDRDATNEEINGGVAAVNLSSIIAGFFGVMPLTVYAQNIALVKKTKIVNRYAVGFSSLFLLLFSLFPVVSSIIMLIPNAVLAGSTLALLGSITIAGISLISKCGFSERNITICSISITLGVGLSIVPNILSKAPFIVQTLFTSPVSSIFIISTILEILLPKEENNSKFKKLLYGELIK